MFWNRWIEVLRAPPVAAPHRFSIGISLLNPTESMQCLGTLEALRQTLLDRSCACKTTFKST